MKLFDFHGGAHPKSYKEKSRYFKTEEISPPSQVVLPFLQHIGVKAIPIVKKGDKVLLGQKIAEASGNISANIHSSVSGVVDKIAPHLHPNGSVVESIFINNDFNNTAFPTENIKVMDLSPEEIVSAVREAGIVGLGGAGFPTHVKLSPNQPIKTVIVNGCECEPFLTADYRLMLEEPEKIIMGALAIQKCVGATEVIVAVEDDKKEAMETLRQYSSALPSFKVISLPVKYPQGGEKQLIYACLGIELPFGKLPADIGVVVNNVATCVAICDCQPLTHRIVTVGGNAFSHAQNYRVPIGTPLSHIVEQHGGFSVSPQKVLLGGPMMGMAQVSLDVPIIKGTGSFVAFVSKEKERETSCIRCGRCVDGCPVRLRPINLANLAKKSDIGEMKSENIVDCIECGCCSYHCPAKIGLLQWIKVGKASFATNK